MFIDPKLEITKPNGEAFKLKKDKDSAEEPMTLGAVVEMALSASFPDEKPDKGTWIDDLEIGERFHEAEAPVDLKAKEVDRIKALVLKLSGPLPKFAVARTLQLLDSAPRKLEAAKPANDDKQEAA